MAARGCYRNAGGAHLIASSVDRIGDVESARRPHRICEFNAGTVAETNAAIVVVRWPILTNHDQRLGGPRHQRWRTACIAATGGITDEPLGIGVWQGDLRLRCRRGGRSDGRRLR